MRLTDEQGPNESAFAKKLIGSGITAEDGKLGCSGCAKFKFPEEFNKNKSRKTGHDCYCKACRREIDLAYMERVYESPDRHERRKASYRNYRQRVKSQESNNTNVTRIFEHNVSLSPEEFRETLADQIESSEAPPE